MSLLAATPPVLAAALSTGLASAVEPPEAQPRGLAAVFAHACVAEAPDFAGTATVLARAGFDLLLETPDGRRAWSDGRLSAMTRGQAPAQAPMGVSGETGRACYVLAEAEGERLAPDALAGILAPFLGHRIDPACSVTAGGLRCRARAARPGHCLEFAFTAGAEATAVGAVDFLAVLAHGIGAGAECWGERP